MLYYGNKWVNEDRDNQFKFEGKKWNWLRFTKNDFELDWLEQGDWLISWLKDDNNLRLNTWIWY